MGIKAEDWLLLPQFGILLRQGWKGVVALIVSPRIQFVTYIIEGILVRGFGITPLPLFLFLLGSHCLSCVLIYRILGKLTGDEDFSVTVALCCLLIPTSISDILYVNHAFFVFPVTMLLTLIYIYLFPIRNLRIDLACLTGVSLLGQFSGEQAVPLFYVTFLLAGIFAYQLREQRLRHALRAAVPFLACAVMMSLIFFKITLPFLVEVKTQATIRRPMLEVVAQYLRFHLQSLYPQSWIFGRFSQPISWGTCIGAAVLAVFLYFFYGGEAIQEKSSRTRVNSSRLALYATLCALIYLTPILLSTISGYRFGVEPKYLYASGFCLALLIVLACDWISRMSGTRQAIARRLLFSAVVLYMGSLMLYAVRDVWGTQKGIDDRIWKLIDKHYTVRVKYLMLDGMVWNGLVPDWRSSAYSDFSGGAHEVPYRLKYITGSSPIIVRRYRMQKNLDRGLELEDGLHQHYIAKPEEILAVVFRYGDRFGDLDKGFMGVFPVFEEYLKFRRKEPIHFVE